MQSAQRPAAALRPRSPAANVDILSVPSLDSRLRPELNQPVVQEARVGVVVTGQHQQTSVREVPACRDRTRAPNCWWQHDIKVLGRAADRVNATYDEWSASLVGARQRDQARSADFI